MRTSFLLVLMAGPVAGGFAGTFGAGLQEILIMMAFVFSMSLALAVVSTLMAFVILSPLLLVERHLRASQPSDQHARPTADPQLAPPTRP